MLINEYKSICELLVIYELKSFYMSCEDIGIFRRTFLFIGIIGYKIGKSHEQV